MCGGTCARAAPALLAHVNLLLAMYGGMALLTGARLKWDPTLYVALRELAPAEYAAAAVLLPAAGLALLLLAHLALLALCLPPASAKRRLMLLLFFVSTCAMVVGEVGGAAWLGARLARWARSAAARDVREALRALRDHLAAALAALAHWHPLPERLKDIIEEAEADLPRCGYALAAACGVLPALQLLAAALALLARRDPDRTRRALRSDELTKKERASLTARRR